METKDICRGIIDQLLIDCCYYKNISKMMTDYLYKYGTYIKIINFVVAPSLLLTTFIYSYIGETYIEIILVIINLLTIIAFILSSIDLINRHDTKDSFFKEFLLSINEIENKLNRMIHLELYDLKDLEYLRKEMDSFRNRIENNKYQIKEWMDLIANQIVLDTYDNKCYKCHQNFQGFVLDERTAKKLVKKISKLKSKKTICPVCGEEIKDE